MNHGDSTCETCVAYVKGEYLRDNGKWENDEKGNATLTTLFHNKRGWRKESGEGKGQGKGEWKKVLFSARKPWKAIVLKNVMKISF